MRTLTIVLFVILSLVVTNTTRLGFSQDGILSTSAGTGEAGNTGDGELATAATFNMVVAVATDAQGNTYCADAGSSIIRKVDSQNIITTICGVGANGYFGDDGPAINAAISSPNDIVLDSQRNIFICDTGNNVVRRIDATTQIITTFITDLALPLALAIDPKDDSLYVAVGNAGEIHQISPDGQSRSFVAGHLERQGTYVGDGGPATEAGLNIPCGLAIAPNGTLYILECGGFRIRKVSPWPEHIITTLAGTGVQGYTGDGGPATGATFNFDVEYSNKIELDAAGNLYVSDGGNSVIRRIDTACCIETVAGSGLAGFAGDGKWAFNGKLSIPYDVACRPNGDIVIADAENRRLRDIDMSFGVNTGSNVSVPVGQEAKLTFSDVSQTGDITVDVRAVNEPPVAGDLQLGTKYMDINTTSSYAGTITVTLVYDDPDPIDETADLNQRILHYMPDSWQDVTKAVRPAPNEVDGEVTSLSPFVLASAYPGYSPVNFLRGDANQDHELDISDPVFILISLFLQTVKVDCQDALDANDDGAIDITDAITILGYLFLKADPLPKPGPFGIGIDQTQDPLGCESY